MDMNATEIRGMSKEEILEKIDGLEEELFNLRFQKKMGQLNNTSRIKLAKKELARAKTVLNEQTEKE